MTKCVDYLSDLELFEASVNSFENQDEQKKILVDTILSIVKTDFGGLFENSGRAMAMCYGCLSLGDGLPYPLVIDASGLAVCEDSKGIFSCDLYELPVTYLEELLGYIECVEAY